MFALSFQGTVWDFPVRPESLEIAYPARVSVVPTHDNAYVDHFGPGVGSIVLSGTTGWGVGAKKRRPDGLAVLAQLVRLYQRYLRAARDASDPSTVTMTFVDGVTGGSFVVVPDQSGLRVSQHKSSPMLRRYTFSLTIIRDLSEIAGASSASIGVRQPGKQGDLLDSIFSLVSGLAMPTVPYQVQAGDTLSAIAQRFGVDADDLARKNGVGLPGLVSTGAVLRVALDTYTQGQR